MKNNRSIFTTKTLNRAAILIAMSIVLKSFLSLDSGIFRVSFFDIPLMILGIMLGPAVAIIGGFVVDWIYVLTSPFAFSFNLMTLATISWAFIPAIFFFQKRKISLIKLSLVVILTSLIAFGLNTWQLYIWTGVGAFSNVPLRLGILIVKLPIQISVINVLYQRVVFLDYNIIKER